MIDLSNTDFNAVEPVNRSTPLAEYNCGGFAFNKCTWLCPYYEDLDEEELESMDIKILSTNTPPHPIPYCESDRASLMEDLVYQGIYDIEAANIVVDYDVSFLLKNYPNYELVSIEDCAVTDRVIAYRIFINGDDWEDIDTDFHFRVRINGFWFEKNGAGKPHLCDFQPEENWVTEHGLTYNSKIVYFREKKEKNNG